MMLHDDDFMLQDVIYAYLNRLDRLNRSISEPVIHLEVPTHDLNRDHTKFRVSDAGKCRLMRYWKRQGVEPTNLPSSQNRLVMESGNLLHAWFQYALHKMQILESAEQTVEDEHRIGHLDCIVAHEGRRILYDLKTVSSKKLYFFHKNGEQPDRHHVHQVLSYHGMLKPLPDEVRIAYISRDTLDICECVIPFSKVGPVIDDWAILITTWTMQEPPKPSPESWECRYCMYQERCN